MGERGRGGVRQLLQNALPQVLQSGTSFLLTLGFAHVLAPAAFGILSVHWLVWMLILSFNRTVFGEQLIARAHGSTDVTGYGSLLTLWISALAILSLGAAVATGPRAILPGVTCVILFVASDAVRYSLIHRAVLDRQGWALLALETGRLVLASMFLGGVLVGAPGWLVTTLALSTGGLLLLPGLRQVRGLRPSQARQWGRTMGRFEAWMSVQFFTLTAAQQLLPLGAATLFSASAFGSLRLTQSVTNPAALVATAFQPVLIATFGRTTDLAARRALLVRVVMVASAAAGVVSALGVAVVLTTGRWWIPADQLPAVRSLILPALVAIGWTVIGQPGGALIRVLQLGRPSMVGQLIGVGITLAAVVVLLPQGIVGFAWALAIGSAATVVATYALITPHLRSDPE